MHVFADRHREPGGILLDRGWRYDAEVWFFDTFLVHGRIRALRQKVTELALAEGTASMLDVGCGTGTLAIRAARRAGASVRVAGIEPAPRQLARARTKAGRAGVEVDFRPGVIEDIPFPDQSFDAVTSTLMLHHLPSEGRSAGLAEVARVVRPQGRLVVADFGAPDDLTALVEGGGFDAVHTEVIEFPREHRGWSAATIVAARRA